MYDKTYFIDGHLLVCYLSIVTSEGVRQWRRGE